MGYNYSCLAGAAVGTPERQPRVQRPTEQTLASTFVMVEEPRPDDELVPA